MTPAPLKLRRAGVADAPAVSSLTRAVYAKWVAVIGRQPRPMSADYIAVVTAHWIDLYDDDGALLALIEMIPHDGFLLVENIAVHGGHQGRGIGAALLDHASRVARSAGLAELRLYTNAAFQSNLAYYRKRGFIETARAPLPDGGTMVSFAKPVS